MCTNWGWALGTPCLLPAACFQTGAHPDGDLGPSSAGVHIDLSQGCSFPFPDANLIFHFPSGQKKTRQSGAIRAKQERWRKKKRKKMRRRGGERGGSPSGQGCRGVEQRVWNWQQHLARDNGRVRGKRRHTTVGISQLSLEPLWVDAMAASTLGCCWQHIPVFLPRMKHLPTFLAWSLCAPTAPASPGFCPRNATIRAIAATPPV